MLEDVAYIIPPQPKKKPQQKRSHMMVNVILDSCKKILQEYGEEAFNVTVLEEVSGVGKGSIYQYFPNLDAVIAALFEREFVEFVARGKVTAGLIGRDGLDSLIHFIIDDAVTWHASMRKLHSGFYEQYKLFFDVGKRFVELSDSEEFCRNHLVPAINSEYPGRSVKHLAETANLALSQLNSLFFAALRYYPEKIGDEDFSHLLYLTVRNFIRDSCDMPSFPGGKGVC
ncbi:TetR/AcrR family transcriptional regulator [Spongiibacter sp. KMU-166]|uniref:TetR/AcrR family transcriptional regulator n=1 Tax=Spongiibacter thalassae TaxID=2721624 RepID=A0ABX1GBK2_9GAMM|nr:TetR/AcrR family transcriptional regulator [Spongiibacter thalassae]NKI16547.1 TetR/AcrR family transcriptional regulator [Spongiibacter thalassae]